MDFVTLLLLTLVGIGFLLVYLALQITTMECPPAPVQYRFIPRTFAEEQANPVSVTDTFQPMFNQTNLL